MGKLYQCIYKVTHSFQNDKYGSFSEGEFISYFWDTAKCSATNKSFTIPMEAIVHQLGDWYFGNHAISNFINDYRVSCNLQHVGTIPYSKKLNHE